MTKYISCYKCNNRGRTSNACTCGDNTYSIPVIRVDPEIDKKIDEYFAQKEARKTQYREINKIVAKWDNGCDCGHDQDRCIEIMENLAPWLSASLSDGKACEAYENACNALFDYLNE